MKILYAIQGTGNGHLCRAREIVPLLQQHGELDILVSGTQADVDLDEEVKYKLHGMSFIFGKKGSVAHFETWKNLRMGRFLSDMKKLPLESYNLIINDFEPVTAWACQLKRIPTVGLGHQSAFKSRLVPKPKSIDWADLVLKYYAPATNHIGFHFKKYDDFIYTPVIRSEIRTKTPQNHGHYSVYLPAFADKYLITLLNAVPEVKWEVFSKHTHTEYESGNVSIKKIDNALFIESLVNCEGLLTGGGFEGPAEALFLGKKLLVAPMKYQYEQQCNAYALKQLGIPVLWASDHNWLAKIKNWVIEPQEHHFDFPDETKMIIDQLVNQYAH